MTMEQNQQMEYSLRYLSEFKEDYYRHGKFNLAIQVPHLAKLAGFYHERFRDYGNWTDCLKAHALYNSASARQPECEEWRKLAYEVQQEYLGEKNLLLSYEDQQKLNDSLKRDIESIRNQSRQEMLSAIKLATAFDGKSFESHEFKHFNAVMERISSNCSEKMTEFASRIISQSEAMIAPAKPPCDFVSVAIGSLARGEATPYSDLEYLFLVEEKSPETLLYFKTLAVASYILMANLGETKLSYMAIQELEGWFDDKSKNGFKIDGLTTDAGNIPTGNGSEEQCNHFIITPAELAQKYQQVLDNPDEKQALRGDLTAMLKYTKTIYSHQCSGADLHQQLVGLIKNMTICKKRQEINMKMLNADVKKFKFRPSFELESKGFAVHVKKEIYRFPSIILLDISIVTQGDAESSWDTLRLLGNSKKLSENLHQALEFLLSAATFIRMGAYLYHDSHDDRMSITQNLSGDDHEETSQRSKANARWFVPVGLFSAICNILSPLKSCLAQKVMTAKDMETVMFDCDAQWHMVTTPFYAGRYKEALSALMQIHGDDLCSDPLMVTKNLPKSENASDILHVISGTFLVCGRYKAALDIYQYMIDEDIYVGLRHRMAECHTHLGDYDKAVQLLEGITPKSPHSHYAIGGAYLHLKDYSKAELSFLQALELFYGGITSEQPSEKHFEPGDDVINSDCIRFLRCSTSPEERLTRIVIASHDIIACVGSLAGLYRVQKRHQLADAYYNKALEMVSNYYGDSAVVPSVASLLFNRGNNYLMVGQSCEAEKDLEQALAMFQKLSIDNGTDVARTLTNLGVSCHTMGHYEKAESYYKQAIGIKGELPQVEEAKLLQNTGVNYNKFGCHKEAENLFAQALELYRDISKGCDSSDIADTLFNMALNYSDIKEFDRVDGLLKQVLAMRRAISSGNGSQSIADTLVNLGNNHNKTGQYAKATECYEEALTMKIKLTRCIASVEIADILNNLGCNYSDAGEDIKAREALVKALNMFINVDPTNQNIYGICMYLAYDMRDNGHTYQRQQKFNEAAEFYTQALSIFRGILPLSNAIERELGDTLCSLACVYDSCGEKLRAQETLMEAFTAHMRVNPNHHKVTKIHKVLQRNAQVAVIQGCLSNIRKEHQLADTHFKRALDIYQLICDGANDLNVALTLCNMACNYEDSGDLSKAIETFESALGLYLKQDPNNQQILRIRLHLASFQSRILQSSSLSADGPPSKMAKVDVTTP